MSDLVSIFLCGDVMTGRGVDQILSHPADPRLFESYVTSALGYVALAEEANGPIVRPVDDAYVWGESLAELQRARPDVRIINLETSITRSDDCAPKGINYRMSPENVGCLLAARIDCCTLANNHVLDWGYAGLAETRETLAKAGIRTAGAGSDIAQARSPAIMEVGGKGRVVVFSFGTVSSGIPPNWAAAANRPGVNLLGDLSAGTVACVAAEVESLKRPGDIVVASIHWGGNWGYDVPRDQQAFAHRLIDAAGVDVIHGHSSHHAKAMEVYRERLILYGCGDFLNDYEGIRGYEKFRDDLALMYVLHVAPSTGTLDRLDITPFQIRRLRLGRTSTGDARWLRDVLTREGKRFGTEPTLTDEDRLSLRWRHANA